MQALVFHLTRAPSRLAPFGRLGAKHGTGMHVCLANHRRGTVP